MTPRISEERKAFEQLSAYLIGGLFVVLLMWLFLPAIWNYLSPFIISFPLAAMLQPVTRWLERRLHLKHALAVLVPVVLLLLFLAVLVVWFASFGINQILDLLNHSPELLRQASTLVTEAISTLLSHFRNFSQADVFHVQSISDSALTWISTQVTSWAGVMLSRTVNWASSIPYIFLYANFLIFGVYFIAKDYDSLLRRFHQGMIGDPETSTGQLTSSAMTGLMGWLHMQLVYALLSLVVGSIYWSLFGYKYAILISIAAAILEFLPVVGNGTIYIPWGIIAFLSGHPDSGFQALGLFYGLLLIRRLTEPKLLAHSTGVAPLLGLMGMFAGLKFGGILGMMAGPMVATVAVTLWEGNYRRTIKRNIYILTRYLHARWMPSSKKTETDPAGSEPGK